VLTALPEVSQVRRDGEQLLVTGSGEALQAIIALIARQGVIAHELRVEQATLDDAYVALTSTPGKGTDLPWCPPLPRPGRDAPSAN
jgi:ABC-2 type transport system ATP-binding protein